jgi:hypothetical protein
MAPERIASVLSIGECEALLDLVSHATRELHSRVVWNVNSTAKDGGVVEMRRQPLGQCLVPRRRCPNRCAHRHRLPHLTGEVVLARGRSR